MNLRSAIHSHITWLIDLVDSIIDGRPVDPEVVRCDDHCQVGQWIHGEGRQYADSAHYQNLKDIHARFHACAASAVQKARDGDRNGALAHLEEDGSCGALSHKLLEAFCDFYADLRDTGRWPAQDLADDAADPGLPSGEVKHLEFNH